MRNARPARQVILGLLMLVLFTDALASGGQVRQGELSYPEIVWRWKALLADDVTLLDGMLTNGRPTLLAFIDKSCGSCLSMVPVMEEVRREYSSSVNIMTVDNERQDMPVRRLVTEYQVWAVPMFVIFDRQGRIYRKLYGPQAKKRVRGLLGRVLGTQAP